MNYEIWWSQGEVKYEEANVKYELWIMNKESEVWSVKYDKVNGK